MNVEPSRPPGVETPTFFDKWIYPALYWSIVLTTLAAFALAVFWIYAHGGARG